MKKLTALCFAAALIPSIALADVWAKVQSLGDLAGPGESGEGVPGKLYWAISFYTQGCPGGDIAGAQSKPKEFIPNEPAHRLQSRLADGIRERAAVDYGCIIPANHLLMPQLTIW